MHTKFTDNKRTQHAGPAPAEAVCPMASSLALLRHTTSFQTEEVETPILNTSLYCATLGCPDTEVLMEFEPSWVPTMETSNNVQFPRSDSASAALCCSARDQQQAEARINGNTKYLECRLRKRGLELGTFIWQTNIDRGSMALTFKIFNYLLEYNLSIGISY